MKTTMNACVALVAAAGIAVSATTASAVEPRQSTTPSTAAVTGQTHAPIKLAVKPAQQKELVVAGRRRGRGAAIGFGIIAGIATAAILSSRARAHHYEPRRSYRRSRHYDRCERWEYRCHELGVRRACRKFYNRCR